MTKIGKTHGAKTKGMKHHVRGCLKDNSSDTNNLCSTLAKWRCLICVDTSFTEMNDFNGHQINITKN